METITSSNANGASVSYTYDDVNRLGTVVDNRLPGNNTTTYTYDPASNLATATYPNGVQGILTYDALNRITGLAASSSAAEVSGYTYQRGPTGNLTSATELSGRTVNWSFDGIYRLTSEAVNSDPSQVNGSVTYSLDPAGNRLSDTSSLAGINSGSFGYNADDEVSTENYDQNGNAIQVGTKTFTFDAENHLMSMSNAGTAVSIVYDAFGNRVAKTVNGVTTKYLVADDVNPTGYPQVLDELTGLTVTRTYTHGLQRISQDQIVDGATMFGVTNGTATWQRTNVYAAGKLLATYDTTGLHFHLTDPLGTRRMQLGGNLASGSLPTTLGQPETDIQSLPFGDQLNSFPDQYAPATADDATPLYFTGKERDTESGNDYFGARYYASSMGRWMSPDWSAQEEPVPYAQLDDPQSLNLYSYVQNNPLWKPDADGHAANPFVWTARTTRNSGDHQTEAKVEGGAIKVVVGIGLVGSAAVGDAPGGALGAAMIFNAVLGGTSTAVSGTTDIIGAATNTDVHEATEALSATSNIPGLVTTAATGSLKAGEVAATIGNAATLAAKPQEAFKNPATAVDAAQTVKDTGGLIQSTVKSVMNFFSPSPPPAPRPPPPPSCSVAGACK